MGFVQLLLGQVNEPSVFTFWAKSAVDFEQCTIQLQSSTHTINAILDTITAACVQVCVSQLGFAFNIVMESLLLLQKLVYESLSKSVTYHGMSYHVHTCFWRMLLGMGWAVVKAALRDGWQRWSQQLQQTLRQ